MDMIAERAFNWAYESKAYSESVRAELSDTTLLAAWKDVFSDTLPACEDKMLKIVDVGTGPGFFPIVLGQMGYPCIGADISPEMLAEASRNAAIAGTPQEFIQADADSFPDHRYFHRRNCGAHERCAGRFPDVRHPAA